MLCRQPPPCARNQRRARAAFERAGEARRADDPVRSGVIERREDVFLTEPGAGSAGGSAIAVELALARGGGVGTGKL